MNKITELVDSINASFVKKDFDKFIHEINFPKYKNFAPGAKFEFKFPVTLLVGPNGGGKSSLLHALWGMTFGYSTSRFWFSTPVDPIDFDPANQNRYWYCHYVKKLDQTVQCRKMCGNKRNGYWEPTRPALKEGMRAMPARTVENTNFMSASGDRWNQVERTPRYINAKAETSAFDRFFYSTENSSLESRQDYFVKYSQKLKLVIDENLKSFHYYGVERIKNNFEIEEAQLHIINSILGKNYMSAKYISHKFYERSFSPSVIFETNERVYSECFAGSGELAVVNCVLALDQVENFDLVLLDEPETSLHPGAQIKLIKYILDITKKKKLQVVISTHSPTFVDVLPRSALIVLDESSEGVVPRIEPTKASAFSRLGALEKNKITVITEDKLLCALTQTALKSMPLEYHKKVIVSPSEVGASEMLSNQVRAYLQTDANILMILDGDQSDIANVINLDPENLSVKLIDEKITYLKDKNVSVVGTKQDLEAWINWCKKRVIFLDQVCPEQIFLELLDVNNSLLTKENVTNQQYKSAVRSNLSKRGVERDMDSQATLFKFLLGNIAPESSLNEKISVFADKLKSSIVLLEQEAK